MRSRFVQAAVSPLVFLSLLASAPITWAQNISGIFVTPIAEAPFSGTINVQRKIVPRNGGPVVALKTAQEVARDSQGRVYIASRGLEPASASTLPPIFRIHLYDPQTRNNTVLDALRKVYITRTLNHPPAAEPADLIASPTGNSAPLNQFTEQEDLGTRPVGGVQAHGVRETQTIPAASGSTGAEVVLTDEYWYSDELHMNVLVKHDDPRTGSVTMTLTQVTRNDPDPALFQIPDGYKPVNAGVAGTR